MSDSTVEQTHRRFLRISSGPGPCLTLEGRPVVAFCANDYLGLAGDSRLTEALSRGAQEQGAGAGAARLISGNRPAHMALEQAAAEFKGSPAALLFGSGYLANISLLPALAGAGDLLVSDARNHASLIDGCRLSRAEVAVVPHRDLEAVRSALDRPARRRFVLTEGLFSMDGHLAPLAELLALAREFDATLIVDDAHGNGVLGGSGRGAIEACGLSPADDLIEIGTFGKAFGGYGAFVAWTTEGIEQLIQRARGFFFSTGLPPGVAAMNLAGLRIAQREADRREKLWRLAGRLREGLARQGHAVERGTSPIIPLIVGPATDAMRLSQRLLDAGFWVPGIRPPTVPEGSSRLRISVSAAHTSEQVERLLAAIAEYA